ncbi:conserved hypothetical protein [Frankia alni ACN14a]|uniref:HEXXH motif domain-containing protein n=1 Tax=Frankia alni (strain DSM 45986 / CECT 9034 / ACN14a) TaxID=326424 RepID=Q0RU27_FRAAA|nr:conserved hypothetical protein [Frankia alni ACN14a]
MRPRLGTHRLSASDVDALALGTLDADIVRRLAEAEISHRRMAFRAVLDLLRDQPAASAPLTPADQAWDLLIALERRDRAMVHAVLDRPFAGAWAARLLRRLRARPHDDVPLWVDVGYLHALAAAAAVRVGVPAEIAVPVRAGVVHLPTLGHTRLPAGEPWETAMVRVGVDGAEVIGSAGRAMVGRGVGSDGWTDGGSWTDGWTDDPAQPPVRGTAAAAVQWHPTRTSRAVGVVIEDADPYRLVNRAAAPVWLPAADFARWERRLADTWRVLRDGHAELAAGVGIVLSTVVPVPCAARFRSFSATFGDAIGGVELSEPHDALDGAAMLAHELRHAVLDALLHVVGDFVDPAAPADPRYAPWRDDPRPPLGTLHGVYAFFGVAEFWRTQRRLSVGADAMLAHFEFALWRRAVLDTATDLLRTGPLTPPGRRFLTGIATTVQGWISEPVPVEARRLADLAVVDGQALWRVHHRAPEPAAVRHLAEAWSAGADPVAVGVPTRIVPDPGARALDTRACLARLWLADRDEFRRLERDGPHRAYRGASRADCALVAGDRARARRLYEAELARTGGDRRALVGLGLAIGDDEPAGRVLRERPELVHAVAAAVARGGGRAASPALAEWLLPVVAQPAGS